MFSPQGEPAAELSKVPGNLCLQLPWGSKPDHGQHLALTALFLAQPARPGKEPREPAAAGPAAGSQATGPDLALEAPALGAAHRWELASAVAAILPGPFQA